jgi:hypothetical protein
MGTITERTSTMVLETEIQTYEQRLPELVQHYGGKFVVFRNSDFVGAFDTFENAAMEAVRRFGRGPYLIRQVGAPDPSIPVSWMCRPTAA